MVVTLAQQHIFWRWVSSVNPGVSLVGSITSFLGAYISFFLDGATGGIIIQHRRSFLWSLSSLHLNMVILRRKGARKKRSANIDTIANQVTTKRQPLRSANNGYFATISISIVKRFWFADCCTTYGTTIVFLVRGGVNGWCSKPQFSQVSLSRMY